MKKCLNAVLAVSVIVVILTSCNTANIVVDQELITIHVNQIGYLSGGYKSAIVIGSGDRFVIVNETTQQAVYKGQLSEPAYWDASGETVRIAEFSDFETPGLYHIQVAEQSSYPFEISGIVYADVATASLKAFYFHRVGMALEEEYAGVYARPAGHPDTAITIHASAATALRPAGSVISSPKGWYDAGDYNKYIVNSAITVGTMMSLYEHYPHLVNQVETNIPESSNETPDLLDEIRYNLDWMLTMQDPEDGGVYHKLTSNKFGAMELPHLDLAPRLVVMKTTPAALDFAAIMAQASRVYRPFDLEFSNACLDAAKRAWEWSSTHPTVHYAQPEDVVTGAYDQRTKDFEDEKFWAATELNLSTGTVYKAQIPMPFMVPEWRNGAALAAMDQLHHADNEVVRLAFFVLADSLLNAQLKSAYDVSNDAFRWGSTSDFLNQAMVLSFAYKLSGNRVYMNAAQSSFDWVLGKNPNDYSFVTGYGDKTPLHIHHRPSEGDGVVEPIPGWVAGGPNPGNKYDCGEDLYLSPYPAKAYLDMLCSYGTNEVAINWNAAFVYVAFAVGS